MIQIMKLVEQKHLLVTLERKNLGELEGKKKK